MNTKSIITTLAVSLAILLQPSFAATNESGTSKKEAETALTAALSKKLQFPPYLLNENRKENTIEVAFMIGEEGKIEILELNNADEALRNEVKKQLSKIVLDEMETNTNEIYRIRIRFRTL
jgi:hypothetical protein